MTRPTEVIVDLDRIRHNISYLRSRLDARCALMAVVKADGYGHGAVPVARVAIDAGAAWLGVALAEEGEELRQAGIRVPILILGASSREQMEVAVRQRLDVTVFTPEHLATLRTIARGVGIPARLHLKLDTGMGRIGLAAEGLDNAWLTALRARELEWVGVFTHFATSDALESGTVRRQLARFLSALDFLRRRTALPAQIHAANSAALLRYPGTHFTLVRAGLAIYGLKPFAGAEGLQPALSWRSRVVFVKTVPAGFAVGYGHTYVTDRPQKLVTVPVGYADGYRRAWSNSALVIIRGHRHPVVGRVSMDQLTVALPLEDPVAVGDPVTLLGADGRAVVSAEELADRMDSISYEVVTGIGKRVRRRYRGN